MSRKIQQFLTFEESQRPPSIVQLLTPDDIYNKAESMVPTLLEDRRIERKSPGIQSRDIAPYLSMWANTSPSGGLIAIGIADGGAIQGCGSIDTKRLNDLEAAGVDRCPEARYQTKRISVKNSADKSDFVLLYRVYYHPTRVVETSDGKVFVRIGDRCKELKGDDERRQLRIDKGEIQHEQEPCGIPFPDGFNMPLIGAWAAKVREYRGLSIDLSDRKVLEVMHLGKQDQGAFVPNIACALIFAKDPLPLIPGCKIRFLKFEGEEERSGEKWNAVKDEWIEGSIPFQVTEAAAMIDSQIRKFSVFGSNGKFNTEPEYPREAWYEALVNACVHRSYNLKNMNIFVKMFDNRLEIESPGPFPPGVSPETIYDIQHSRNPFLMEAMHYLDFVKAANEGVRRIRDTMLALKLPAPKFSQTEIGHAKVSVVLQNNAKSRRVWVDADVAALLGAALTKQLTEDEKLIINFVALHGMVNVSDVQRLTKHNWHTGRKKLVKLQERGILLYMHREDVEIDRQAYWILAGAPK